MELALAKKLVELSEETHGEGNGIRIYKNYSGRGMMGARTAGVTGSKQDIFEAFLQLAGEIGGAEVERSYKSDEETEEELDADSLPELDEIEETGGIPTTVEDLIDDWRNVRWDNMGRDDMIAY